MSTGLESIGYVVIGVALHIGVVHVYRLEKDSAPSYATPVACVAPLGARPNLHQEISRESPAKVDVRE